jgi:phosphomannomutase
MAIVSVSGIRGIAEQDLNPELAASLGVKFGNYVRSAAIALGCDTRTTSFSLKAAVCSGLVRSGCTVYDLEYSSTPSIFKEVAARNLDGGIMVTASHNPPEWNGIKFVLKGGRGIFEEDLANIQNSFPLEHEREGRVIKRKPMYLDILRLKAGYNTASGIKVALDLAGGVGSLFIPSTIANQGCIVHSLHDSPGLFPRIIDPTVDPLMGLSNIVTSEKCDVGFAYDCDADRLVIVDQNGDKMSGDATLLICLRYFLENSRNRRVAISVDTSLAAEDLVREYNGKIVFSKVGEGNVVRKIIENNCGAGGEGSSGGYIEPAFVMCRDGVYASTIIVRMIKTEDSLSNIISNFRKYYQYRTKIDGIDTKLSPRILQVLSQTESDVDLTDGVKIRLDDKSWVLVRSSNTENVMRISAESKTRSKSKKLVEEYTHKIKEIAKVPG